MITDDFQWLSLVASGKWWMRPETLAPDRTAEHTALGMRRLFASLSTAVLLSGVLAPGVLAACCQQAVHPCCAVGAAPAARRSIVRPPCCARAQVKTAPAQTVVAPKRSSSMTVCVISLRAHGAWGARFVEPRSPALLDPGLQRALGPPLRLRI